MGDSLASIGSAVANHLWQSTAFAAVAWGATLLLRRNQARVRYAVWLAASLKFVVPFALLIGLGGMLPRPHHAVVTMPVYSAVDEVGLPFAQATTLPVAPTHAALEPHREWGIPTWPVALAGVWLFGAMVVVGVWCCRWLQVLGTLRRAAPAEAGRELECLRRIEASGAEGGSMPERKSRPIELRLSGDGMEPGIFGVFRPVLIWPRGLSERLNDAHLEAIVAHEVMHVRRRDNLTAALHMLVEAAFWFHPAVWWMGSRLIEERERACDEAVVELGSRPGVYAESLLKAVRFCLESPVPCVAGVTGADLKQRVRSIMTAGMAMRMGLMKKTALAALVLAAVAAPVAFGVVRMIPLVGQVFQPSGPLPAYEFVVIKPSQDDAHGASTEGDTTHYLVTAKMLIQFAYGVSTPGRMMNLNVVGGPDWINNDVFDIVGKVSADDYEKQQRMSRTQGHERRQLMEQSLLADRFHLKMHTETQDQPVYALTVIKGGPKITVAKNATGGARVIPVPSSTTPEELTRGLIVQAKGRNFTMTVKGMTLDSFVNALMAQKETAGQQVLDQTGLKDAYDFTLTWGPPDSADATDEALEPPLFTAIQQQLGLKLAESKGPGEVVVIDHIEKPSIDSAAASAAQPSRLSAAVATGQRLLGSLVPVAFGQGQPVKVEAQSAAQAGDRPLMTSWVSLPQPEAPAELCCGGGFIGESAAQIRINSKADKRIFYFRLGSATVRPTGLEFSEGETIVPYNGMPPHGTYGFEPKQMPARRDNPLVLLYFVDQVVMDDGTSWQADRSKVEANFKARYSRYAQFTNSFQSPAGDSAVARLAGAAGSRPAFEAATVKPNVSDCCTSSKMTADQMLLTHETLKNLIVLAYAVQPYQVSTPDWMDNVRFDVTGKYPPGTKYEDRWPMLRTLLEDRFGLKVHREVREMNGYSLVVAPGGFKLKPSEPGEGNTVGGSQGNVWTFRAYKVPMSDLAWELADSLGEVVVDKTGLDGVYDYRLRWANNGPTNPGAGDTDAPSVFTALEETLGLRLQHGKVPAEVIVVDHAERAPTEN